MTGVILFRAQPFHNGHLYIVRKALQTTEELGTDLYIFVGSADKVLTKRNPLPITLRLDLINISLNECLTSGERKRVHIVPLDDLSDEANNTWEWGSYLYHKIIEETKDEELLFFYSDKPTIMLSWFGPEIIEHLCFKFIYREDGLNATAVREMFLKGKYWVEDFVPPYVYENRNLIQKYLQEAK